MKTRRISYLVSTVVLTGIMLFSAYNYFFNYETIAGFFEQYHYPTYLIYPLAIAKLLGLVAIWGNFSSTLKNLAYAGFLYNTFLAATAHFMAADGGYLFAVIALICVIVSYLTGRKIRS